MPTAPPWATELLAERGKKDSAGVLTFVDASFYAAFIGLVIGVFGLVLMWPDGGWEVAAFGGLLALVGAMLGAVILITYIFVEDFL